MACVEYPNELYLPNVDKLYSGETVRKAVYRNFEVEVYLDNYGYWTGKIVVPYMFACNDFSMYDIQLNGVCYLFTKDRAKLTEYCLCQIPSVLFDQTFATRYEFVACTKLIIDKILVKTK